MKFFNFKRSDEAIFNDIVEGAVESVQLYRANSQGTKQYKDMQKAINENVAKYLTNETRYAATYAEKGAIVLKDPNVNRKTDVIEKFNAVIAQVINAVIPMCTSETYGNVFMDVHQVGWGDTARFIITSNELFKVNEVAEGVRRSTLQTIYNNEITVNCGTIEIATYVDWYSVATGVFDWGDFGYRAGRSFNGYIMLKGIAGVASAVNSLGSGWKTTGFTTKKYAKVVEMVSAANAGQPVYALGTLAALNNILPEEAGLQYGLGDKIAEQGFLDKYLGSRLIPIDQFIVPGTINADIPTLGVPDDKIYLIAAEQYKPVKVVFEGDSVIVEKDATNTTDKTYGLTIQMKVGVAAVVGSKFGEITLD